MMTIEEIESACEASTSQALDFLRHLEEPPELPLHGTFYPLGFPAEVCTNSPEVLEIAVRTMGNVRESSIRRSPSRVYVHVAEGGSPECPPPPKYRFHWPLLLTVRGRGQLHDRRVGP